MRRNLLIPRKEIFPEEYPEFIQFVDAINNSMWFHDKWDFSSDKNDYENLMTDLERSVTKRTLLSISQIEVEVKSFWANIAHRFPKPEVYSVAYSFAESEVRHQRAYRALLEVLDLKEEFNKLLEVPAIKKRVEYLSNSLKYSKEGDMQKYIISLALFTLLIENSALFGLFSIIKVINKEPKYLKDTDNVVIDTTKEENIHALFGVRLLNILKEENIEIFPKDFDEILIQGAKDSYESECEIIDWVFEKGDLPYLSKEEVKEYIKYRLNYSLDLLGIKPVFQENEKLLERFEFFELEQASTIHVDFFHKKNPNYNKFSRKASTKDLF